jgi:predicted DNA-binding transcriptional regulator YafY
VPALRKRLNELARAGVPLDMETDSPHVYWSVPKNWLPGAVQLNPAEMLELHRLLNRLPSSISRNALLKKFGEAMGNRTTATAPVHVLRESDPQQAQFLSILEDHIESKKALRFKYFTASRATLEWREASPYRVDLGPPIRFVARCHRSDNLRWFRLDHVQLIAPQSNDIFRKEPENVDEFIGASLDGYHEAIEPLECRFFVSESAARWVKYNLPEGFSSNPVQGGIEATGVTAGIRPLARFIVGLGEEARAITPELADIVREIAAGSCRAHEVGNSKLKLRSVRSKRSTR